MGVLDFDTLFALLDPTGKGYLGTEETQKYYEALHHRSICIQQIEGTIRQLCGSSANGVTRQNLLMVLQDIERRHTLEEQLRWDFMALDQSGTGMLPIKEEVYLLPPCKDCTLKGANRQNFSKMLSWTLDACCTLGLRFRKVMMMFSMVHGDAFSMQTWQSFLSSRGENVNEDVYFDEVKVWLCGYPEGTPASTKQLVDEQNRLDSLKEQQVKAQLFGCVRMQEIDELQSARDKQDYDENTRKLARRKLNRWEREGIEGIIYDDGRDHGEEISPVSRTHVGITELTEALQLKYDLLRKKLFWDMLKRSKGESAFNQLNDTQKIDLFQQLQMQESQMRSEGFLDIQAADLVGAKLPLDCKLQYYMGELRDQHNKRKNDMYTERLGLRSKNKTDTEVDKLLKEAHDKEFKGPLTCADMLIELDTRYLQEKKWAIGKLRSDATNKWSHKKLYTEYCCLIKQHMLAELEDTFYYSCMAVGLAEREQHYKPERYDPDRARQEQLAKFRLTNHKQGYKSKFPYEDGAFDRERSKTNLEVKLDIVKEVVWKHIVERESIMEFLTGPESGPLKQKMSKIPEDQRSKQLTSLRNRRNKWREYTTGYRASQRQEHINTLQEGTIIYYETCRQEHVTSGEKGVTDDRVCACVMADLQQKHDIEFNTIMQQIQSVNDLKELQAVKSEERKSRREEVFDNIAGVVLGTERWTEEEIPFIEAVDAKYYELRRLLFSHVLELEHGVSWHRLSERDRLRFLERKSSEEQKLRDDGQLEQMANLIQRMPKDAGSLRSMMGEDRAEYGKRMTELSEMIEQSAVTGHPLDPVYKDEKPGNQVKFINLLADMIQRSRSEEDAVVGHLRTRTDLPLQERLVSLVQLKIERRRAEREEQFDVAALSIGIMERIIAVNDEGTHQKSDQTRQYKLALARVHGRRRRIEAGRHHRKESDESRPNVNEVFGWMEAYIKERDKKHTEEIEILLRILQDASFEDLTEAAKTISDDEKHKRLAELQMKRRKMDMHNKEHQDENISVVEEAAAIRFVLKKTLLEKEHKREMTKDEVCAHILAQVQDEQDREMSGAVSRLGKMELEDLDMARTLEIESRHWGSAENVVYVLTQYEGSAQDKQILKALDEKYDAIRVHVLEEILSQDESYSKLSSPEKYRKLVHLKIQEQKFRREGNFNEIAKQIGTRKLDEDDKDRLHVLLGETKNEYEKRLKKINAGIPTAMEEDHESTTDNVFEILHGRHQLEKEALLAVIRGSSGVVILTERQREVILVRLQYEKRQVSNEVYITSAALAVGLSERQQPDVDKRNKTDRWRQERLAELRLDHRGQNKHKDTKDVVKQGGGAVLKEAVLQFLEDKHYHECQLLMELVKAKVKGDQLEFVKNMSEVERQNKLMELREKRSQTPIDKTKEQHLTLSEGSLYKKISRSQTLRYTSDDSNAHEVDDSEIVRSFLADLQERQYMEAEQYIQKMIHQDEKELILVQTTLLNERKLQVVTNVAEILLCPEESKEAGDHEIVQALENKYDTLRDKILAEALISQLGESEWQKLSEREKQRRMIELKIKERKLREEGKEEEANRILGDAAKNSENLRELLGTSRAEFERRLAEKKAKRQQRLAEGFTEEEVNQLEEEEEQAEKTTNTNVMAQLDACFEKEKEELLKSLAKFYDGFEKDRARQLELARQKRAQRQAREEEKFSAAALYISVANEQTARLEDHRDKQEQLAKERLAEKLKQRKLRKQSLKDTEVPVPEDHRDVVGWIESITKEVELRHSEERELLMQLLNDETVQAKRQVVKDMNKEAQDQRLEELRLLRDRWKDGGSRSQEEHKDILREACSLTLAVMWESVSLVSDTAEDNLNVVILANLQEQQDKEMTKIVNSIKEKTVDSLKQLKSCQVVARKRQWFDNVALVLIHYPGADKTGQNGPTLTDVLDALEKKYDVLTDMLMEQVLRTQLGGKQWEELSDSEKQQKIITLKLRNRQLRHQGKRDEANALFGEIIHDADLVSKLGDSRSQQRRKKEERLQLKKQMLADRKQQSLSVNETVIEALLDEEMEKRESQQKLNVLELLQEHFDDEKEQVVSSITNCDSGQDAETLIQLELARLVREKKRLTQEQEFGAAAALLNIVQHEKAKDPNLSADLDKQKSLALARLNARMKQTKKSLSAMEQLQLEEQNRQVQQAQIMDTLETQDNVSLHASVLSELELKQESEREKLMDLIHDFTQDTSLNEWTAKLSQQDRKFELEKLRQERSKWKTRCLQRLAQNMETNKDVSSMSSEDLNDVVSVRQEQEPILLKAVCLRIHVDLEDLKQVKPSLSHEELVEEIVVKLLIDLQQKQVLESNAVSKVAAQQAKSEFRLKQLLDTQISATREGWCDNLANVVFTLTPVMDIMVDDGEEVDESSPLLDDLEEEFKQEKENLITQLTGDGKSQESILAQVKKLEEQQEERRQSLIAILTKQKDVQKAKQEARKQTDANREYEDEIAMQMSKMANRELSFIQKMNPKYIPKDLMSERIQERREARHRANNLSTPPSGESSRQGSAKHRSKSLPGIFGLKREKTVVDVSLTDDQISETQKQLMRDVAARNRQIAMEQRIHEDKLQKRLMEMKQKKHLGVQEIFTTMERQRSDLDAVQQDERARQLQRTREDIERRREQKTKDIKERGSKNASQFQDLQSRMAGETTKQLGIPEEDHFDSEETTEQTIETKVPHLKLVAKEGKSYTDGDAILEKNQLAAKRKVKPDSTEYDIV